MGKTLTVLILLIITSMNNISGQETNVRPLKIWSVSLSYAPVATFFYYRNFQDKYLEYYRKGVEERTYRTGFNLKTDYKLNNRLSVSSGINFKFIPYDNLRNVIYEWSGSYYEKSSDDRYIFEIPLEVSYHILSSPKFIDPFIKTGLRNSYFKQDYVGEYTRNSYQGTISGEIDVHESKFILFYELGAGTYLNFTKSISLMFETNITYTISGLGIIELLGGLRYSFN